MIILFDNNINIKTIQINDFLKNDYKIFKNYLKDFLNNNFKIINFDLYNINNFSYYYIMKIIYFFTKKSDVFLKQFEKFNLFFNEKDRKNVEYYSNLVNWKMPKSVFLNYINSPIKWKNLIKEQNKLL